jgi:predicted transcriptional regulator
MRSDLIFGALTHVTNRYKLCQLASKATRKLHKPNTRLQDTTNEVLDRFKDTIPMNVTGEATEEILLTPVRRAA